MKRFGWENQSIELAFEPVASAFTLVDGIDELLKDDPLRRAGEYELGEPAPMCGIPGGATGVPDVIAEQERLQSLLGGGDIALALLPGAYDVPECFLRRCWDVDRGGRTGSQCERKIASIAPVGLHAISGTFGDQRRSGNDALLAPFAQVALKPEPAGAGLVNELQTSATGEFLDQSIDCILLSAEGAQIDRLLARAGADAGCRDGVFVNVESDEDGGIVFHADLRMREPTFERIE